MFHFVWPWLALLLPLPFLMRFIFPVKNFDNGIPEIFFPSLNRLSKAFPAGQRARTATSRSFYFFLFIAWCSLIVALMQPERVDRYTHVKNHGYDIMLAVDMSASMQALDFSTAVNKVSRLDVTKEVVEKFVSDREGDRVGLIIFGESAYLHVPLTLDTHSVSKMLKDTVSRMAGTATAIGDAIGLGVRTLRDRPSGSRVMVLLTDGEDNSSSIPPIEAAKLAQKYGIKIYTIGIGKNGPVPFPLPYGGYGMAEVPLDEELLKEIAELTKGKYYRATDQKALQEIYDQINLLEKTEAEYSIHLIRDPYYAYPLALAILILLGLTMQQLLSWRFARGS